MTRIRHVRGYKNMCSNSWSAHYYRKLQLEKQPEVPAYPVGVVVSPGVVEEGYPRIDWLMSKYKGNDAYRVQNALPRVGEYRRQILGTQHDKISDEMLLSCIYNDAAVEIAIDDTIYNSVLLQRLGQARMEMVYDRPNLGHKIESLFKSKRIKTTSSLKSMRQLIGLINVSYGQAECDTFFREKILSNMLV